MPFYQACLRVRQGTTFHSRKEIISMTNKILVTVEATSTWPIKRR